MNAWIDTTVIFIFSIFLVGIGLLFMRTGRNLKSFFAGGEAVPWFVGGLSLFMSFFSAGTFVAWGSIAYKHGWVAITIQWTMCIGAIVTGLFLAPRWKKTRALTAAEFIKNRLGARVQQVYVYIFILVSLFIKGTVLYPVAKLVSSSLGFPLLESTIVLGLFMIAYTALGGLWAVMVTDILQFVVLSAAVLILLPLAFEAAGGSQEVLQKLPSDFFQPLNGEYTLGFIIAFLFYHICYIGGNWTFVQRYTSVDSPASARKVAYLFAALYLISPVIWMIPPMIYRSINPDLQGLDTENAYLQMCQLVLPPGLLGLMLTGMYFSTSASANTTLNVVSAVFTNDIYKGWLNPQASDRQLMRVARGSSWGFGLGMILVALLVPYVGGIVSVILSVAAITGGPLLAPPLWALFSKRLTGSATLWITGISLGVNLVFKIITPAVLDFKLSRAAENSLGIGLPLLLLTLHEIWVALRKSSAVPHLNTATSNLADASAPPALNQPDPLEQVAIAQQNRFGLQVIAGSLAFTGLILLTLSLITSKGAVPTFVIALLVLLSAWIPYRKAKQVLATSLGLFLLFFYNPAQAQNLHGDWDFRTDPNGVGETEAWYQPGFSTQNWDKMAVPSNWDLRNEYAHYIGKAWYRYNFETKPEWKDKIVRLVFESVFNDSKVWLNGRLLGENHLGFLPFELVLNAHLNPTGNNTLVLCVDNTFRRGAIWNWGGIRRPVKLEITEPLRFVRNHITAIPDLKTGTARVAIRVFYHNHGTQEAIASGAWQIMAQGKALGAPLSYNFTVPAQHMGSTLIETTLPKTQVHLWHFDDPFLYELQQVNTQHKGGRFGIRKVELDLQNYAFKLNGESVRLMGYNLVPDDRTNGNTFPEWRYKEDIDLLKQAGANLCRISHLPLPEEVLDYLDERGIMTFEEVSLWGYDRFADPAEPLAKEWLQRLITKAYNHPAVIGWSVGNEIGDYPSALKYVEGAIQDAQRQDSTRLAITVSHTAQRPNDILQFSDLGTINKYGKNLGPLTRLQHQNYPNKILFYTEFGIGQLSETLDADLDAKSLVDSIRHYPYLIGASLWTFNDYRSAYFGTKEFSENRPWGVVDVYRQKKRAFYSMQKEFAPIRSIQVKPLSATSAQVQIVPRSKLDLPAYTLRKHRLVWQILDQEGNPLQVGFQTLPEIAPASATLNVPIAWNSQVNAAALRVEWLAPTQDVLRDTLLFFQKPATPRIREVLGFRTNFNGTPPKSGAIRVGFEHHPSATTYKLKYGKNTLDQETPPSIANYLEVQGLTVGETYQIALVAINAQGESMSSVQTLSIINQLAPPIIQHAEPKAGGFSLGYASQDDDYLYRVQVSTKAGDYTEARTIQTSNPGTLHVYGLQNGQKYFYRLQKIKDNYAPSAWTTEASIVPDGGLPLPKTSIKAVVQQEGEALLLYTPLKKATGYSFEYRKLGKKPEAWQSIPVNTAQSRHLFIAGLDPKAQYEFRVKE
jgi:beta-galactosidase